MPFYVAVTMVFLAKTKEELDSITDTVMTIGKRNSVTIDKHYLMQREAVNTALPIGVRQVETMRTMLTQSLASLLPFNVQELQDETGVYYGINQVSKNINVGNPEKIDERKRLHLWGSRKRQVLLFQDGNGSRLSEQWPGLPYR